MMLHFKSYMRYSLRLYRGQMRPFVINKYAIHSFSLPHKSTSNFQRENTIKNFQKLK